MEKLTAKLSESILDKLSMDFLRNQVLKNAYGNDDTVIAALDPRILLAWYLFFGLVPWFVSDIPFLLGCFLLVMATTLLARVAGLVLFYDTCNWIYAYITWDERINARTLQILRCDYKDFTYGSEAVPLPDGEISLKVCVNGAEAQFYYKADGGWQPLGGVQPADHLSDDYIETRRGRCAFTGAMVGICAQDMDAHQSHADFAFFDYEEQR